MGVTAGAIRAGRAFYELAVQNNPLVKGLKGAEHLVKASVITTSKGIAGGFSSIGQTLTRTLTSPVTALVAALAPIAAGKLFAGMGTEITDISRRTGASTDALQSLGYAAKRTGQDLGAIEGALTHVRDKITEAARGSEDAQLAFGRLGLSFLNLSRMRPEDQFRTIAERLNQIPNRAIRAALAAELLGSADLLPTIDGMKEMEARARRLGLVLSGDTVAAGKQLGNAIEDLHSNLTATASVIGAKISPAITQLISRWVEMSGHTRAWIADNTAMFSSAEALWAFLKLQWAKGSAFISEQFGLASGNMKSVWIDTEAALESGWERFKHGAGHAFGWVGDVASKVFKEIAQIGMDTFEALSNMFAYISDDMAAAMQKAANAMARMMKKLNIRDAGAAIVDLGKEALDQDNPELKKKLHAIELKRWDRHWNNGDNPQNPRPGAGGDEVERLKAEYAAALAKANANRPGANPIGGAGGAHAGGAAGPGIQAALMHVQGIGATDVRTKEGFASVAASLRQQQIAAQTLTQLQRTFIVERDIRDRITKILVVGKK